MTRNVPALGQRKSNAALLATFLKDGAGLSALSETDREMLAARRQSIANRATVPRRSLLPASAPPEDGRREGGPRAFAHQQSAESSATLDEALVNHEDLPASRLGEADRAAIAAAMAAVIDRREARSVISAPKKTSLHQKLASTREIHLVRFTTLIVQREIERLRRATGERKRHVELHEHKVKHELADFLGAFVQTRAAQGHLDHSLKRLKTEKNELAQEINRKKALLESLKAENRKHIAGIAEMRELKDFIEKLSPAAYHQRRDGDA